MKKFNQIRFGAILSYLSIAINIVSGLLYTPWMVERIGQGDYGLYTLANSVITLFLVDFGLSAAVSRYISTYRAEGRQDKIDNLLGVVYKLYLLIDGCILLILATVFVFIDQIYVRLTPEELERFKIVYLMAASFAIFNFPFVTLNGILNAYEKFIPLKLADIIYRILLVAITVGALLMGYGLYALVGIHALVGLGMIGFKLWVIKRQIPIKIHWRYHEKSLYRELFSFSIWVTVATLALRLVFNITPTILGMTAGSTAIAVFGIVTTIEGYSYTITTALNGMFMPKISRIYAQENAQKNIMPLMLKVGKLQYALNGLIIAGFAVIGKEFIYLWVGPSYADAYYGILLVTIPGLFYNSLEVANTAMIVEKRVKTQAYILLITGLINVSLSMVLSRIFGVIGACVSIFIAYMFRDAMFIVVYHRVMRFNMYNFTVKCFLRMGIPIIVTTIFGAGIKSWIPCDGWPELVLIGCCVCVIYMALIWTIGLSKGDKKMLFQKKQ